MIEVNSLEQTEEYFAQKLLELSTDTKKRSYYSQNPTMKDFEAYVKELFKNRPDLANGILLKSFNEIFHYDDVGPYSHYNVKSFVYFIVKDKKLNDLLIEKYFAEINELERIDRLNECFKTIYLVGRFVKRQSAEWKNLIKLIDKTVDFFQLPYENKVQIYWSLGIVNNMDEINKLDDSKEYQLISDLFSLKAQKNAKN